jgi:hypothetical protein
MAIIYEVTVKTGTYQKDGQEKIRYQRIGDVIETKKGPMLKIHTIPVIEGGWSGWCYLFVPKTDDQKNELVKQSNNGLPEDLDIPF